MAEKQVFRAVIEEAQGGGAFVTVPFDVEQVFGKKRAPVRATIDGQPYRGSLVRMGGPGHILGVLKEIREKIGKGVGEEVEVVVEEDAEPRQVQVPADLQAALQGEPEAEAFFRRLSYTHQREYVEWIVEAKREQTREARIGRAIELLKQRNTGHVDR